MSKILITGSSKGLGLALTETLRKEGHTVYGFDINSGGDVRKPTFVNSDGGERTIPDIDILINNAGVNVINWLEDFEEDDWDKVMDTNAKGIYMMSRACLPMLSKNKGTIVNIVSNAAHMPMTCSLAYNASKAAAHIMTLQLARELTKKHDITVFGIAPNKEYAQKYQLNGLLTGEETPPNQLAEFIGYLLQSKQHHKYLTGCILPYGA